MGTAIPHETIDANDNDITEYHQVDYIPADPALKAVYLNEEGKVFFGPILCWQIQTVIAPDRRCDAFPYPVTPVREECDTPVLFPDGTVRMCDEAYENVDAWVAEELQRRQRKQEKRKSRG